MRAMCLSMAARLNVARGASPGSGEEAWIRAARVIRGMILTCRGVVSCER
jgi:hypothetical protein